MPVRVASVFVLAAVGSAAAAPGVQVGARGGVEFQHDVDATAGAEVRVLGDRSPLTLAITFDDIFDAAETLYQLGGTLLYDVPVSGSIAPYVGLGANVTAFSFREHPMMGVDDSGNRLGLNLTLGATLDLGVASPFVQVTQGIGAIELRSVTAGVLVRLRRRPQVEPPIDAAWRITPYVANEAFGDAQPGRLGIGLSLAYYLPRIGFELDGELHGHFFRDRDVAGLVPDGVDLNTEAALGFANVVVPYCMTSPTLGRWCPYAVAGAGIVHATFDGTAVAPGSQPFAAAQTNVALDGGLGVMHDLTRHVAVRVDARYVHVFVDEDAHAGGYFQDYGFVRLSMGVAVGL